MNVYDFHRLDASSEALHLMMGVAVFMVLVFAVARLLLLRRAKMKYSGTRMPDTDWRYGTPVEERPDEKLTDISTAMYLWQQSGIMCTHRMIECLDSALQKAGYDLTRDRENHQRLCNIGNMHPRRRRQVADDLVRAKERFWAPEQSQESVDELVRLSQKSGFGEKMLEDLLDNLGKRGWQLRQIIPDYELTTYPLQQVVVKMTGAYDATKDDLIQCLKHLTGALNVNIPSADVSIPDENGRFCTPEMRTGVRYSVTRTRCDSPPGFFPAYPRVSPPPALTDALKTFNASLANHIVVLLQCRCTTGQDMLVFLLEQAISQLEKGKISDISEDDDTGYAFLCQGSCFN